MKKPNKKLFSFLFNNILGLSKKLSNLLEETMRAQKTTLCNQPFVSLPVYLHACILMFIIILSIHFVILLYNVCQMLQPDRQPPCLVFFQVFFPF